MTVTHRVLSTAADSPTSDPVYHEIREIARRRSLAFLGRIRPEVLVAKTLRLYEQGAHDPTAAARHDPERWVARTMREIAAGEDRRRHGHVQRRPQPDGDRPQRLSEMLSILLIDVRAPSLAVRRKAAARRVFGLLGGRELEVAYARASGWTVRDVALRLGLTERAVQVIHHQALQHLRERLTPALRQELQRAVDVGESSPTAK